MITILMHELSLGCIGYNLLISGSDKYIWHTDQRYDGEDLVTAEIVLTCSDDHLRQLWVQWELTHHLSDLCEVSFIT